MIALLDMRGRLTMSKAKKVILFIVEGITDSTALGGVLTNLLDSEAVHLEMTRGDITTKEDVNAGNIIARINAVVREAVKRYAFRPTDLQFIVHLIDTDGAFISNSAIQNDPNAAHIKYTINTIQTAKEKAIQERNIKKSGLVGILRGRNEINKIPYKVFYFSRNMEHVFHNEIRELTPEEKMVLAEKFDDDYADNPQDFLNFISSSSFAVNGDYKQTWDFITQGTHSLERWSNFHIYFENETREDRTQEETGEIHAIDPVT